MEEILRGEGEAAGVGLHVYEAEGGEGVGDVSERGWREGGVEISAPRIIYKKFELAADLGQDGWSVWYYVVVFIVDVVSVYAVGDGQPGLQEGLDGVGVFLNGLAVL